ncbi:hypothetical protein [Delftia acidovorans]
MRITEAQLDSFDLSFAKSVLVAAPTEVGSGIEVFKLAIAAPFVAARTAAQPSRYHQLIVEVDDPDNPSTQERIRTKCMQRWKDRAGNH